MERFGYTIVAPAHSDVWEFYATGLVSLDSCSLIFQAMLHAEGSAVFDLDWYVVTPEGQILIELTPETKDENGNYVTDYTQVYWATEEEVRQGFLQRGQRPMPVHGRVKRVAEMKCFGH